MIAINRFLTGHSNGVPVVLTVLPKTKQEKYWRLRTLDVQGLRPVSIDNIEPRRMKSV